MNKLMETLDHFQALNKYQFLLINLNKRNPLHLMRKSYRCSYYIIKKFKHYIELLVNNTKANSASVIKVYFLYWQF